MEVRPSLRGGPGEKSKRPLKQRQRGGDRGERGSRWEGGEQGERRENRKFRNSDVVAQLRESVQSIVERGTRDVKHAKRTKTIA